MANPAETPARARQTQAQIARGDALAAKRDIAGALAAYRQALADDESSAAACRRLVKFYCELRRPAEGLAMARRLRELQPRSAFAAASAADMLEALGRVEESHQSLAPLVRAGARNPYLLTVYGRACERLEPPRDEALPLLEGLAADPAAAPRWRVKALWILVHTLDRLGRYDEAFAHAERLKALEAGAGIGRAPQNLRGLNASIAAYTRERLARLPRASHGSQLPLFVVGMLRSGTTLVEQILASHPQVHGAGELAEIALLAMHTLPALSAQSALSVPSAPPAQSTPRSYADCLDALGQAGMNALAAPYLGKLRALAPRAERVIDKMPTNFEHLGLIDRLFPQARVIHCVREPLDTCLSLYFLPDTSRTETLEAVAASYNRYRRIMQRWQKLLAIPMLTLRYEELVAEPERKVRELLEFCGLPWNDACLDFHRSGRYSRNFSHHQVRKPLYARSVGRHLHYGAHLAPLEAALAQNSLAQGAALQPAQVLVAANRALDEKRFERAAALARSALGEGAPAAVAHFTLAVALAGLGEHALAIEQYGQAIAADPALPQAHNNRGNLLIASGRIDEAIAGLRRAIELKPGYALAHYNLGNALKHGGRIDEAIAAYRRALELRAEYPEALNNLGNALKEADRLEESAGVLRRAVAARPDFGEALHNLAGTLQGLGRTDEAIALFRRALAVLPGLQDAHFGLALALLLTGQYTEAWQHHESRWNWSEFPGRRQMLPGPMWHGERFEGKTLMLYFEQGMGDTMQFVRYVPLVAARGGKVVLQVQRSLVRLCASLGRWARVIASNEACPAYDLQCPLQSLPLAFGTTLQSVPSEVPYLHAGEALLEKWRARLRDTPPGLKIGLVWAGNARQKAEPKRGVGLEPCLPLLGVPGTRWFSLQVGERGADLLRAPPGIVTDLAPELTDFAETAAAIANLDLVITTDTSVAHLAGALAAPAWVMLRHIPDWRWGLEGETCRWYPGMRLFRQPREGDWAAVVAALQTALEGRVAQHG